MRRISLALALLGAAAAGCGGGKTSDQGGARGVAEGTFTITIQNGQGQTRQANGVLPLEMLNGRVTSAPTGINCAAGSLTGCSAEFDNTGSVVLTAAAVGTIVTDPGDPLATPPVPATTVPAVFLGWAGDCQTVVRADGTIDPTCTLSGKADKYVLARFGKASDAVYHGNWSDPANHGPQYLNVVAAQRAGTDLNTLGWNCFACHGSALQGVGAVTSCQVCHSTGMVGVGMHEVATGHNSGTCARCHTGSGFRDYVGADATADNHLAGFVSNTASAAALNNTTFTAGILCDTCHNATTALGGGTLNTILFAQASGPGVTVTTNGVVAICGQCHTGQRDGYNVAQLARAIKSVTDDAQLPGAFCTVAGVVDATITTSAACTTAGGTWTAADNAVVRAHFLPAASTLLGKDAGAYYQYTTDANNLIYTARNEHGGLDKCSDCHDPHNGALPADAQIQSKCGRCHFNEAGGAVSSFLELEEARQFGFEGDIDGDGNSVESVKAEIDGLAAKTYGAIQAYATTVAGTPICAFDNRAYILSDATVACGTAPNTTAYNKFTPRLLRAFFNYLMYQNDPGVWAHNPRYVIEVLFDTIQNLNAGGALYVTGPINRAFRGHFGAAEDVSPYAAMTYHAYSNPPMGFTSGACYQCHGGKAGLAQYLLNPAAPAWPVPPPAAPLTFRAYQVTSIQCSTCHALDAVDMRGLRSDIPTVNVPGQKALTGNGVVQLAAANVPNSFAVCVSCHSGRENGTSITNKIAAAPPSGVGIFNKSVTNPHYLGAGGMMLGNDAQVAYQYAGMTYSGKPAFWAAGTNGNAPGPHGSPHGAACTGCHQPKASMHTFEVDYAYCGGCHTGQYALAPIEEEFLAAKAEVLTAIRAYATANQAALATATGVADFQTLCYNPAAHPYFYVETSTGCSTTSFAKADSKLLPATFNYLWMDKEPGAWAHNEFYAFQVMYDTIVDLNAVPTFTVTAKTLPYPSTLCDPASALNRGCVAVP